MTQNDMPTSAVNIPLLRKAVEWAEAEAAKPAPLREWEQGYWVLTPEERARKQEMAKRAGDSPDDYWSEWEIEAFYKAPECGTCYCIAGFIAAQVGSEASGMAVEMAALDALNLDEAEALFDESNTIEDVRRIAEEIAGERL